ncbi:MAG: glutamine-hydrolyzing carbamoyl-phosphate synthase small subunit [Ignavibacteriales bacterium]|nr:glutamine-hydrolyzing carbamoyl-phosphate synthase small subunit [Ignavibacteriales bacterium]MCF8367546.1 glutamine-hydrolyzing carbamoyl-phosphate synthase small subunit [Bacteroidales bacterium]MCF8402651.1 glutamine-hydrolyzing carbamoyl-phosphate synthase small subunit [Bacteroidales bacterium]
MKARLILENGMEFPGISFGSEKSMAGEVVFNTAMTGYPESLTDPSYKGQILVSTYPLVGNYGVPGEETELDLHKHYESGRIAVQGFVISDYSEAYSHWNAQQSLGDWLKSQGIPGISGIDTRELTQVLRESGTMLGKIIFENEDIDWYDPNKDNLVGQVSPNKKQVYGSGKIKILLLDCGVKNNIIRCLLERGATVIRVPYNFELAKADYDGLFITNGPGDPEMCVPTIATLKMAIADKKPIFGICLGSQLMALASGARTYKLKYGHRSHNQPVQRVGENRCYITSQNHGFAVDELTLSSEWEPLFINVNDGTCEGIKHKTKPFFSTQFHPEASGGPTDTEFLFDDFINLIKKCKNQ